MLHELDDDEGVRWRVWDVNPEMHKRAARSTTPRPLKIPNGWLCFECDTERRRLSPIPEDWELSDEFVLRHLCSRAEKAPKSDQPESGD